MKLSAAEAVIYSREEMKSEGAVLCCLLLAGLCAGGEDGRPLVGTRYGKLLGKTVTVKDTDRQVHAFYGVPFAKPPVGPLRFAASGPPESWNGVKEATEHPPMCLQGMEAMESVLEMVKAKIKLPPTSEDCLYLNLFTPADRGQDAKLPVMVFIHGGGLVMGAAMMFEGSALSAHENVIVVSIQYRLGILGFFSSGDRQAPGNYGFLDQVEALRWVQENIADFGGDPDSVTIFGESAGGISVSALVLSPLAKGLFHRAIAESGVALVPGLITKSAEESSFVRNIIANISGCDVASLVDCLKAKSEEEILSICAAMKFLAPPATVDGVFLPKPAEQILAEKENNPVPFLTGVAEQEFGWNIPVAMNFSGFVEGMDRETVTAALQSNPYTVSLVAVLPLLMEEYFGDETDPTEVRNRFLDLCGDFVFVMPALKTAKYHRDSGYPVYFYEFRHRPSFFKDIKPKYVKADHGDELFFVIGGPFLGGDTLFSGQMEEDEKVLSKNMMKYWANFARTGDPNGPGLPEWPPYDQDEDYLQIDIQPKQKAAQRLKDTKYEFWTKVLPEKIQKILEEAKEHRGEDRRPLVGTRYGKLLGKTLTAKDSDRKVHAFYGVPFAKPPVGALRFAASVPPEGWNGVREATEQPPMCLQNMEVMEGFTDLIKDKFKLPPTSEDCLYLNVFTPADRRQDAKLPVMVFIHGGGLFMGGAMIIEGSALSAHENVIVVSIQYRLGILGFFSSGDRQAPGNYGFLDQVEALRWVQENIADFGGDPDSVTIFGESAGGISVSALVLSPLAKGLFHRAIAESGVALIPGLITKSAEETSFVRNIIANISGCDVASLVDCLKAKSEEEILSISAVMKFVAPPATVDGVFLPKPAEQILAAKENNPVPFITGVVEQEFGWFLLTGMNFSGLEKGMDRETITAALQSNPLTVSLGDVIPLLVEEYLGDETDPVEVRNRFVDLCGDYVFVMPALKTAKYHRDSGYPVYFYEFRHRPSLFKDIKPDYVKADHGDELFFVIGGPFLEEDTLFSGPAEEDEKVLSKNVMKYWANFARTGDPNGPGLAEWPRYDQDEDYLQIDIKPKQKAAQRLKDTKYEFWTKILPEKIQKILEETKEHGGEDGRPLVGTQYGKLLGKTVTVKDSDRAVHAFYGIPFAKPPVGPLRFAASGPPEGWNGVRKATEQPPMCLQSMDIIKSIIEMFRAKLVLPTTSEDCLYLNIFTPADRGQDAKLPVMVFIHGGGFAIGGAMMFEGFALSAHENVIVVSIQYRLGILGFFSSGDSKAPGNYGLLDQVEALRWVQENIADFGGDPNSVTIFGESAGGISVSALVLSPLAKGLFHRAIAESGVALVPGLITKSLEETSHVRNIIANISGCDLASLVDCLKIKSEEEILSISAAMKFLSPPATVDGIFLPKPAEQILAEKENNPVEFMTGVVEQEFGWVLPSAMNISGLVEGMDRETVSSILQSNPALASLGAIFPLLMEEYLGEEMDPIEVRNRFLDLCGDFVFVMPALKTAKYHRDSGYPVYFYEFRRRPSHFKDLKPDFVKADHGDEIFFVIGGPFLGDGILFSGQSEEDEKILSKNVMKYWANFARTGDPNGPGLAEWPRYDQDEGYLQIDIQPKQKVAQRLKDEKYKFWTKILPEKIQKISEGRAEHSEL